MLLISMLAFITAGLVVGILVWLVFFKRALFDPRVYVLYGMVHWLLIGQIGTLLGYQFYEVRPYFEEITHAKATFCILAAIIFFLAGYSYLPHTRSSEKQKGHNTKSYDVNMKRLALVTSCMGIIGLLSMYVFQKEIFLIYKFNFLPLLVTYLTPSAAVCASYILIMRRKDLRGLTGIILKLVFLIVVLLAIIMTNITFVFPLFALLFWYFNRMKMQAVREKAIPAKRPSWRKILMWAVLIALVAVISLVSKIGIQRSISRGESVPLEMIKGELLHRLATLDLFNPEGYGIVLHVIEMYANEGNYLFGKSFLVSMPFLRLVWPELRGFGRIMVLDVYGPSYETINVGWSIPPIGELLANFSYPSIPFFYFLLGLICRSLYRRYQRSNSPVYLGFYSVFLPWLFMQQRGDFLNGTVFPAYIVLTTTFIFWLCRNKGIGPQGAGLPDRDVLPAQTHFEG